jgi:hypothetical protein
MASSVVGAFFGRLRSHEPMAASTVAATGINNHTAQPTGRNYRR